MIKRCICKLNILLYECTCRYHVIAHKQNYSWKQCLLFYYLHCVIDLDINCDLSHLFFPNFQRCARSAMSTSMRRPLPQVSYHTILAVKLISGFKVLPRSTLLSCRMISKQTRMPSGLSGWKRDSLLTVPMTRARSIPEIWRNSLL